MVLSYLFSMCEFTKKRHVTNALLHKREFTFSANVPEKVNSLAIHAIVLTNELTFIISIGEREFDLMQLLIVLALSFFMELALSVTVNVVLPSKASLYLSS